MGVGYNVETKVQSSQWVSKTSPRPKKARQVCSHVKVMLMVFFDSEGVVHYEFLSQGQTINEEYYLEVMQRLHEAVRKKDLMRGGRIDECSNMTARPHIHHSLSVTSWPNTGLSFTASVLSISGTS